jgi:hypothetical protein
VLTVDSLQVTIISVVIPGTGMPLAKSSTIVTLYVMTNRPLRVAMLNRTCSLSEGFEISLSVSYSKEYGRMFLSLQMSIYSSTLKYAGFCVLPQVMFPQSSDICWF